MSTSPVLVPISLVSQFLANEKMASRHWLQCQMECLLDQVFDQLSTKFEDYLASNAITGTAHHTTIDTDHIQQEQIHDSHLNLNSHPRFRATTDHLINTEFHVAAGQLQNQGYQSGNHIMNSDGQINLGRVDTEAPVYDHPKHPLSLSVPTLNQELSNKHEAYEEYGFGGDDHSSDDDIDDYAPQNDSDEQEVKEEFDDTNNQLITTEQMSSSLSAPSLNEHSNHNLIIEDDDEDDCDCDDCRNGIEVKEEGGDDDDDVQFIEDNDEYVRHAKIPRIDATESCTRQSLVTRETSILASSNQTDQIIQSINVQNGATEEADEKNNQDKQIITINLQCQYTGCLLMFSNKTELNQHMNTQHQILLFRCVVKDCNQSFSTKKNLKGHIK